MTEPNIRKFLDRKVSEFNNLNFIAGDPVSIPHLFAKRQDIEIAGFFAATFSWGIRKTIINKSKELLARMDIAPYDFCMNHRAHDLRKLEGFCHRTFNDTDLLYFVEFLHHHYSRYDSLETAFFPAKDVIDANAVEHGLNRFYNYFFSLGDVPHRTLKHIACPAKKSACKRLNMFLRWMVRNDNAGVDFGLWKNITAAQLVMPLDVHVARVARRFKLITGDKADWQTAIALTHTLKKYDKKDPVKYDFALFSLGVTEKF